MGSSNVENLRDQIVILKDCWNIKNAECKKLKAEYIKLQKAYNELQKELDKKC